MASDDVGQQGAVAPAWVLTASAGDAPTELYALLRSVIDSTPAAIHVKDLQGRYVLVNRMAEEVLGLLASVALGRTVDDFAPPELAARAHAQDARVAHEGVTVLNEESLVLDGERRWAEVVKAPWRDAAGSVVGVVTVSHESTTRKRAEAARQCAEAELDNLRRMEALGLLAASVAHDFRNILGIIQNNVTLAGMDLPEDHPSRAPLADVGRAVERARGLCSQLGALARRSEGAQQQVDLNAVVRDVITLLTPPARPSAGASLALAQDLHPVRGDPDELGQVVLNLATNGLDAMAGRGRLSLTTRNVLRPREGAASAAWACLSVTDTGPGIDPTVLPRVFEPYFSTKRDRGMGLGLAIVQRVVSDHGGFVEVESTPGRGSEFRMYLPAAPARASEC